MTSLHQLADSKSITAAELVRLLKQLQADTIETLAETLLPMLPKASSPRSNPLSTELIRDSDSVLKETDEIMTSEIDEMNSMGEVEVAVEEDSGFIEFTRETTGSQLSYCSSRSPTPVAGNSQAQSQIQEFETGRFSQVVQIRD
jgi:hypothetical protein